MYSLWEPFCFCFSPHVCSSALSVFLIIFYICVCQLSPRAYVQQHMCLLAQPLNMCWQWLARPLCNCHFGSGLRTCRSHWKSTASHIVVVLRGVGGTGPEPKPDRARGAHRAVTEIQPEFKWVTYRRIITVVPLRPVPHIVIFVFPSWFPRLIVLGVLVCIAYHILL